MIAEKFQSSGENEGVAVGMQAQLGGGAPGQPGHLSPAIVANDYIDLDAYVSNKAGYTQTSLKDTADGRRLSSACVVWDDPAMKHCVATIQAAEPPAPINDPVTATSSTPVTWTAPEPGMPADGDVLRFRESGREDARPIRRWPRRPPLRKVTFPVGGGLSILGRSRRWRRTRVRLPMEPDKNVLGLKTTAG